MAYRKSADAVLHGARVVGQKRVSWKTANVFVVVLIDCRVHVPQKILVGLDLPKAILFAAVWTKVFALTILGRE